ncbi:hypothetical protein GCM10023205_62270 [Yinghuangia aomiensis]|uniref:Uncharacterized protein n=1 Tax=Yinghuangia aomiensis TaxID=676205 RepID=A0ABP9I0Z1_9ACTN
MAPRPHDSAGRDVPRDGWIAAAAAPLSGARLRHRLVLAAPTVGDVVQAAGGLIFDRMIAGWHVLVLVAEPGDQRPLQVLGAVALDLESALASPLRGPRPHAIAVAADLYHAHRQIRDRLHVTADGSPAEVRLWGHGDPGSRSDRTASRYRPSAAARAFKTQALMAASQPPGLAPEAEVFHSLGAVRTLAGV